MLTELELFRAMAVHLRYTRSRRTVEQLGLTCAPADSFGNGSVGVKEELVGTIPDEFLDSCYTWPAYTMSRPYVNLRGSLTDRRIYSIRHQINCGMLSSVPKCSEICISNFKTSSKYGFGLVGEDQQWQRFEHVVSLWSGRWAAGHLFSAATVKSGCRNDIYLVIQGAD